MKDEEMAEEIVKRNVCEDCNRCQSHGYIGCDIYRYSKDSCLAGLKAGRPQWHTPDVPTSPINKVVLGYIKHYNSKQFCLVGWNGEWWYDARTYNDEVKLIAWCEIPTFYKE